MIVELTTYRIRCDLYDCHVESIVHAKNEADAIEESNFAHQHGELRCPWHRLY